MRRHGAGVFRLGEEKKGRVREAPGKQNNTAHIICFPAARRGQNRFFLLEKKISGSGLRKKENHSEPLEIPLVSGGSLTATRAPSCAAAADIIVTIGFSVGIDAACVFSFATLAAGPPEPRAVTAVRPEGHKLHGGQPGEGSRERGNRSSPSLGRWGIGSRGRANRNALPLEVSGGQRGATLTPKWSPLTLKSKI